MQKCYTKFESEIYVLTKEEGGRGTAFSNYQPQFYLRTTHVTGKVDFPKDVDMVMPGNNVTAAFELNIPVVLELLNKVCINAYYEIYAFS